MVHRSVNPTVETAFRTHYPAPRLSRYRLVRFSPSWPLKPNAAISVRPTRRSLGRIVGYVDLCGLPLSEASPSHQSFPSKAAAQPQVSGHTLRAVSTTNSNLRHCWSSVSRLPSSLLANPHCGLSASCSIGTYLLVSSIRRSN